MISIGFNGTNPLCVLGLTPKQLFGLGCDPNDEFEWTLLERPIGSAAFIANPTTQNPQLDADLYGEYLVQFCCTTLLGDAEYEPPTGDDGLKCPKGALTGSEIYIPLIDCPGQVVWTVVGAVDSFIEDTNGVTVFLSGTPGLVEISVDCVTDAGTETFKCEFETYNESDLTCQYSEIGEIEVELCGENCQCVTRRFIIKEFAPGQQCQTSTVCVTVKDDTEIVEDDCP